MRWLRRHAPVLLVGYLLFLAVVLLSPGAGVQTESVLSVARLLAKLGVGPSAALPTRVELVENVLIIVPVSFLVSVLRPRVDWRDCTAWGFVAAGSVEAFQGLFLSGRSATFVDVVANTLGALLGALLVRLARWIASVRRSPDRSRGR